VTGNGYGAGIATPDIGHIGKITFKLVLVFVPQRQFPDFIFDLVSALYQTVDQCTIITEHSRGYLAECNYGGTG
jgi:hypothetical protein